MENIASIVLTNTTNQFDKEYHYKIPVDLKNKIYPGVRVIVPFGKSDRLIEGYVLDMLEESSVPNLKEISKLIDEKPMLEQDMINLALWMKKRYICTFFDAIKCMVPAGIGVKCLQYIILIKSDESMKGSLRKIIDTLLENERVLEFNELKEKSKVRQLNKYIVELENKGIISVSEEFNSKVKEKIIKVAYLCRLQDEVVDDIENNKIMKIQQIRILEMLIENEYISIADIVRFSGVSRTVIETLRKNGYIEFKDMEVQRDPIKDKEYKKTQMLKPTEEQGFAISQIGEKISANNFYEVLLHGITGSGKTEVYLQLIEKCINQGKQAIVLVPEISLTPQTVERFAGRFGDNVAVLHSRLSLGERLDQWKKIKDGKALVAVGARSAVFAPFKRLGIIIVDEEHEYTYKAETIPKYNAKEVAQIRCKEHNAVLLLGSATPDVETYYRAKNREIGLFELKNRANNAKLPKVDIIDMREELAGGNRTIFSEKLKAEIEKNLKSKEQTILFLNKRGYQSFVLCRDCGYAVKCLNCNITLTYHSHDERLICHYCGYTIKNIKVCPKCKGAHIKGFGAGTQKVEEEIKKTFSDPSTLRMDMDTTTYKSSHETILKEFKEKNTNILIGTQMIAKGLDFPNVTLVGILAADSMLNSGDFRSSEKTFQLVTQVAGRAGRGSLAGRVVIQSYNVEDYSIIYASNYDYESFYKKEIMLREELIYPPFTNIAVIIISGFEDRDVFDQSVKVKEFILTQIACKEGCMNILGPVRAPITKIKNKYRWRIIIKCKDMKNLMNVLTSVSTSFKAGKNLKISIDINPYNML